MFDFAQFPYDFATNRLVVGGEPLVLHCHHYNCFLQRSIQDAEYIDSAPILVGAAAEVGFAQLTNLLAQTPDIPARKATVEALYRACGIGLIDLGALTDRGGEVRTRSTHYSTGWKEKFGRSPSPVAFFSTGFLAGALAAIYGLPLAGLQARQTACRSTGAAEDVFVLGRGPANFTIFPPRQSPVLIPVGNDLEPATAVDREAITRAVAGMPLPVNDEGLIPVFGVYASRLHADYYNRISFAFEREMAAAAGTEGVEVAAGLFIEAGHVCAFNTLGGIMTSPEWDALMSPMLKTREDWVHGIVAWWNACGYGAGKVVDLSPTELTVRLYNDYESVGYRRMYGTADHGVGYLVTGGFAGIMNLIYLGDIHTKPDLTAEFYDRLFKGGRAFRGRMTASQAMGDPYTEIRAELAEPAPHEQRLEGAGVWPEATPDDAMIRAAEKVYDCLHRERYRYTLGSAVDDALVAQYANTDAFRVSVYDARHLLPQACVTFRIERRDGSFLINGALGLDYVTITYRRDPRMPATRAAQEAILARLP